MNEIETERIKKPVLIVFNTQSGKKKGDEQLTTAEQLLKEYFSPITAIAYDKPEKWQAEIDTKAFQTIIAAGGDGTINAVANYLVGKDLHLGILPFGTFNHFAKYTGLPLELKEACQVIGKGKTELIDAGLVNGRIFLNFAILGIFVKITREKQQKRMNGQNKWLALLFAVYRAFIRNPAYSIELCYGPKCFKRLISLLLISNNIEYFNNFFNLNRRRAASALQIGMIKWMPRYRLILLLFKTLLGRSFYNEEITSINLQRIIVTGKKSTLVGIDGEVVRMDYPLNFTLKPKSLKIIVR